MAGGGGVATPSGSDAPIYASPSVPCASRRLSPIHCPPSLFPPSPPMSSIDDDTQTQLTDATRGFDELFQNELDGAREIFATSDGPFHLLGLGACAFLEAALGMEVCLIYQPSAGFEAKASADGSCYRGTTVSIAIRSRLQEAAQSIQVCEAYNKVSARHGMGTPQFRRSYSPRS